MLDKDITIVERYSFNDEPDNMGRWARKILFRGLHIAWINRMEVSGVVKFHITTNFPVGPNDSGIFVGKCEDYPSALDKVNSLWAEFREKIK